ncbi:MAG TPA: hypothetical protein VFX11_13140, partial [Candidatus Kapabacteria bacterium]|nr:hypothetical protein [Candidatus Kapabacteria bacterium]
MPHKIRHAPLKTLFFPPPWCMPRVILGTTPPTPSPRQAAPHDNSLFTDSSLAATSAMRTFWSIAILR